VQGEGGEKEKKGEEKDRKCRGGKGREKREGKGMGQEEREGEGRTAIPILVCFRCR